MKQTQKKTQGQQTNKISIVKNKEIIIYQNGEEFKRFKQSETKDLNEDELYILDFLLKKYSLYEVPSKSSKLENDNDFDFESTDEIFKKKQGKNQTQNFFEEDEDRKTEPKLKEFFNDIEDENGEENEDMGREDLTQTKKLKKEIRTTEDVKVPIQKKNKNMNYRYEEENVDIEEENQEEEESEESPQYIVEAESYTSPTIRHIDENKAENELLNGIKTCLMINGQDKKGVLFLGEKETIIFICFEDKKETIISLNNIKRIYFNIRGTPNLKNYKKKTNNERFIQFVELNNKKTDFKFNNDTELEYFIKGLIKTYKNKTQPIDKNIIYQKNSKFFTSENKNLKTNSNININTSTKKEQKQVYTSKTYKSNKSNISNKSNTSAKYINNSTGKNQRIAESHYRRRNVLKDESEVPQNKIYNYNYKTEYNKKKYYGNNTNYASNKNKQNYNNNNNDGNYEENYDENYQEENYEENNGQNYNEENNDENNENNNENYENNVEEYHEEYYEEYNEDNQNNKDNYKEYYNKYNDRKIEGNNKDDDFVTTTKIEVFKDGKLINEETQEEYGGVVRTLHSYSPDIGEYEEFLKKSTKRKSNVNDDDMNRNLDRVKDINKFK